MKSYIWSIVVVYSTTIRDVVKFSKRLSHSNEIWRCASISTMKYKKIKIFSIIDETRHIMLNVYTKSIENFSKTIVSRRCCVREKREKYIKRTRKKKLFNVIYHNIIESRVEWRRNQFLIIWKNNFFDWEKKTKKIVL